MSKISPGHFRALQTHVGGGSPKGKRRWKRIARLFVFEQAPLDSEELLKDPTEERTHLATDAIQKSPKKARIEVSPSVSHNVTLSEAMAEC